MFQLAENRQEAGRELRDCVVETLQELMKDDDKITALEADLGGASGFTKIKKTNPERFIQCGIAEANMMGVAAGLSLTGFKPFTHTFAPFATRRVFDQLFLSGAYAGNTINVYGSDPGFSVASNGGTHTAWEDVALIREIPGAVICDPADDVQMEWIIKEFLKMEGIHYVRSNRKAVRNVYKKGSSFKIGQGNILKEGKDILIIAAGQLVSEALDCAEELEKEGYYTGTDSQYNSEVRSLSNEIRNLQRQSAALATSTDSASKARKARIDSQIEIKQAQMDSLQARHTNTVLIRGQKDLINEMNASRKELLAKYYEEYQKQLEEIENLY